MSKFPLIRTYIFTFLVILGYLCVDFYLNGYKEFFQLNYDWSNKKKEHLIKNVKVDTISHNYLKIKVQTTLGQEEKFNPNYTFSLHDKFVFRSVAVDVNKNEIIFRGVFWINFLPEEKMKETSLSIIELPLIQKGDQKIMMIGDSQLTWREGKFTRKKISKKIKKVKFVGSEKDVFGYPYESKLLSNTKTLVKDIDGIEKADTYILFLGAHEQDLKNASKRLEIIIKNLLRGESKLILISPPNYMNKTKEGVLKIFEKTYTKYSNNPKVVILNLGDKNNYNPQKVLAKDGIHLNTLGHEVLTNDLIQILKKL
jgi:hypothetical protein